MQGETPPASGDAAQVEPVEQAWSLAEPAPEEAAVAASEGIREAVSEKSETVGSIVDTLDSLALSFGDMRVSVFDVLIVIVILFGVIAFAWFTSKLSRRMVRRVHRLDDTQQLLVEKIITIVIWAAAFFLGIDLLGIDLTALAVFSGAFGLAIGFGLQKTFGNLIAGIILLMDKSIKPGDVIAVADQAGVSTFGQIRKIGIRAVSITTRDQKEYLIPNENLMINQVVNWSYSSRDVRVKVPVGVSYSMDMDLVEELLLQAARQTPRILKNPEPRAFMVGFGDSSVDFEIRFWIDDPEEGMGNVRSDVLKRVWSLFQENNIEIPFPQRDLNLRTNKQFDRLIEALTDREETRSKS